jgi:DNA helicase-2/ATP-dependent DNA helicase PcrA
MRGWVYPARMSSFDEFDAFEGSSLSARAMAARPMPYLDELNPAQREAVETLDGPVLMLAGAGTGKTKALTARMVHLLNTGRARPNEILSVTFTNKAAREMKTRMSKMMGEAVEGMPWLGTFHSICVKLLRRHAELICADDDDGVIEPAQPSLHLKSNFTILDTDDQLRLLKQLIKAAGVDEKRHPPRSVSAKIDAWKNNAWSPDRVPVEEDFELWGERVYTPEQLRNAENAYQFARKNPESGAIGRHIVTMRELYDQYQRRLLELNAVDFGDLLLHMVTIFQTHPDILERYQRWFRYILVDEYQDTNVAQYLWLRLLAQSHKNICCVGDDDQSIYGWRGAEVGNILRFEQDFPGAHVVRLEQNYRSTPHILAAASGVIRGNANRLGKELWTAEDSGEKVRLIGHWDGEEEARWIGDEIESMQNGTRGMRPYGPDQMAILVRASHQMRAFEDRFLTIGLPYRVIGGPRFYERLEIRDAMAYFRLVVSPSDDLAFERIVNTPKRGLGDKAQQTIQTVARENGVPLLDGAAMAVERGLIKGKGGKALAQLVVDLARWGRMAGDKDMTHMELAEVILDESGYTTMWLNDKTPEAPGRLENLKELIKALENFENLQGFLEHVSLVMENDSDQGGEKVSIMTLHGAKGLEFPVVFLPGWEDGLFPSQRSMDESGGKGLEEERRLFYVALTRAEKKAYLTYALSRYRWGKLVASEPSRFIEEIDDQYLDITTPIEEPRFNPMLSADIFGDVIPDKARKLRPEKGRMMSASKPKFKVKDPDAIRFKKPLDKKTRQQPEKFQVTQPKNLKKLSTSDTTTSTNLFDSKLVVGNIVKHQRFGKGEVVKIEGTGTDIKAEIKFEGVGVKKLLLRFAKLDVIG